MKEKMPLQTAQKIVQCLLIVTLILCVAGLVLEIEGTNGMSVALAAIVSAVITAFFIFAFIRCPHCGRVILWQCVTVKRCPHCHKALFPEAGRRKK